MASNREIWRLATRLVVLTIMMFMIRGTFSQSCTNAVTEKVDASWDVMPLIRRSDAIVIGRVLPVRDGFTDQLADYYILIVDEVVAGNLSENRFLALSKGTISGSHVGSAAEHAGVASYLLFLTRRRDLSGVLPEGLVTYRTVQGRSGIVSIGMYGIGMHARLIIEKAYGIDLAKSEQDFVGAVRACTTHLSRRDRLWNEPTAMSEDAKDIYEKLLIKGSACEIKNRGESTDKSTPSQEG